MCVCSINRKNEHGNGKISPSISLFVENVWLLIRFKESSNLDANRRMPRIERIVWVMWMRKWTALSFLVLCSQHIHLHPQGHLSEHWSAFVDTSRYDYWLNNYLQNLNRYKEASPSPILLTSTWVNIFVLSLSLHLCRFTSHPFMIKTNTRPTCTNASDEMVRCKPRTDSENEREREEKESIWQETETSLRRLRE